MTKGVEDGMGDAALCEKCGQTSLFCWCEPRTAAVPAPLEPATTEVRGKASPEMEQLHEWLGTEEVNGWVIATCSCGWTYQHPNYGTSADSFVNHWGDHIIAAKVDHIEGRG